MTQLLIRLFIRHPDNPQDPHTRAAYGNLASIEQNGNGLAATVIQTGANQQVNVVQTN